MVEVICHVTPILTYQVIKISKYMYEVYNNLTQLQEWTWMSEGLKMHSTLAF